MNSIPLIKGNTPQEINTSIIALKKALSELEAQDRLLQGTDKDVQNKIKQINELIEGINTHLGTVDNHLTAIDDQITALQPVDTVTSGNMHSVTSNAVAIMNYAQKKYLSIVATNIDDFITQLFNYCCNNQDKSLINGDWSGQLFYNAYAQTIDSIYTMVLLFTNTSQAWFLWGQGSLQGLKAF
jgi:uncharacterized phage infection (PIP) family protein YhgE